MGKSGGDLNNLQKNLIILMGKSGEDLNNLHNYNGVANRTHKCFEKGDGPKMFHSNDIVFFCLNHTMQN